MLLYFCAVTAIGLVIHPRMIQTAPVCMCMYVCMYAYMLIYIYKIHIYMLIYTCFCITYACMYVCIYACTCRAGASLRFDNPTVSLDMN